MVARLALLLALASSFAPLPASVRRIGRSPRRALIDAEEEVDSDTKVVVEAVVESAFAAVSGDEALDDEGVGGGAAEASNGTAPAPAVEQQAPEFIREALRHDRNTLDGLPAAWPGA